MIIQAHGEMSAVGERLESVHSVLDQPGPTSVLLDFENLDYTNSAGIALTVGFLARARVANLEVAAYGLSDHYREIFRITRLTDSWGSSRSHVGPAGGASGQSFS